MKQKIVEMYCAVIYYEYETYAGIGHSLNRFFLEITIHPEMYLPYSGLCD